MKTKTVYLYDPFCGEFKGTCEAHPSPLEPGLFHEPVHSTPVQPPLLKATEAAVFSIETGAWSVVQDFRGQTFFDEVGNAVSITLLGDVPSNLSSQVPASIALGRAKYSETAELNAACAASIVGGFTSSALGAQHTYDSALEDQLNLIGAVGLGIDLPYRCADASGVKAFRTHTAAQLKQVAADGAAIKLAALEKAATLKAQVQAAADVTAVNQVVW